MARTSLTCSTLITATLKSARTPLLVLVLHLTVPQKQTHPEGTTTLNGDAVERTYLDVTDCNALSVNSRHDMEDFVAKHLRLTSTFWLQL